MIRVTDHSWIAKDIAVDQIAAAARRGDYERLAYWVDRLVDHELRQRGVDPSEPDPFALVEEVRDLRLLPTIGQWINAGAPMRELT